MGNPRFRRGKVFQYRLLWQYRGQKTVHVLAAERPLTILKMVRRLCGTEPWRGATKMQIKRGWAHLARRLGVVFSAVAGIGPRDLFLRIQQAYGELNWLRVEFRQVGPWVEMQDPLENLQEPGTAKWDARCERNMAEIEAMTPEQLDAWRVNLNNYIEGRIREHNPLGRARDRK